MNRYRMLPAVLVLAATAACSVPTSGVGANPVTPGQLSPGAGSAKVVYEVIGKGPASNVTYAADGGGSIAQEASVKLPWRKEVSVERGFAITTVSAQNAGSGQITCRISVDGQLVKELTSTGQYSMVSCTGEPIS